VSGSLKSEGTKSGCHSFFSSSHSIILADEKGRNGDKRMLKFAMICVQLYKVFWQAIMFSVLVTQGFSVSKYLLEYLTKVKISSKASLFLAFFYEINKHSKRFCNNCQGKKDIFYSVDL